MLIRLGQSEYQGKSTRNPIRKSKATKGRTFLLKAVNLSGKSPAVEVNRPEGNGFEWFFCVDTLEFYLFIYYYYFLQRTGFHEGEKGPIYRCMPTFLILTIFFLSSHFVFFAISFKFSISQSKFPLFLPLFYSRQGLPFIVPAMTRFYYFNP